MSMIQRMIDTEVNIMISKCNLKVLSPPFCDIEIVVIYIMYKNYKFRKGKSEPRPKKEKENQTLTEIPTTNVPGLFMNDS